MPYRLHSEEDGPEARAGPRLPGRARASRATSSQSFNDAFEGVIHVVRTQRNMRLHFGAALIVLPLGLVFGVSRLEMLVLILAVGFVIVAEMFNTAVEMALDVATNSFDPRARIAKDVAAGTVLVAAVTAVLVAYLVLGTHLRATQPAGDPGGSQLVGAHHRDRAGGRDSAGDLHQGPFARGTPLRGGLPSGHAAIAFGGWAAITFVTQGSSNQVLISTLAFVMALLVVQTRVEARGAHDHGGGVRRGARRDGDRGDLPDLRVAGSTAAPSVRLVMRL